jgi:hypothetical protein
VSRAGQRQKPSGAEENGCGQQRGRCDAQIVGSEKTSLLTVSVYAISSRRILDLRQTIWSLRREQ